jgi:RND family efflux transporter MFP subunit
MKYALVPLALATCLGVGWLIYQNSLEQVSQSRPNRQPEAISVHVTPVRSQTVRERLELVGSLEPGSAVEIRSRISGYIRKLNLDVGDAVEQDSVVIEIDDLRYREMLKKAEAALKVARAQLRAQARKQALALDEVQRYQRLAKSGVSTQQQQQQAEAQLAIMTAELELEQARVEEAESELEARRLELNETQIRTPVSGYVAERHVDIGDLAKPDVPLLRIVNLGVVRTVVHVIEKDYRKVQVGQEAKVYVDAFPEKRFDGMVIRKAPVLDPETRTAAVHVEIQNTDALLKPGMYAIVSIEFDSREVDVVPVAAIVDRDNRPSVYVVTGTPPRTERHDVQVGVNDGNAVEILAGVAVGDRVVTLGGRIVQHGQAVNPIAVAWPSTLNDPFGPALAEHTMGIAE